MGAYGIVVSGHFSYGRAVISMLQCGIIGPFSKMVATDLNELKLN